VASGSGSKLCWAIEFDSSGDFFYSNHLDGYIRKWSLAKKEMVQKSMIGNISANLAVAPDDTMLVSLLTPADHGLVSFSRFSESGVVEKIYQERVPPHSHNSTGKFSKDGKSYYQALVDGRLQEWKITESGHVMPGRELLRLPAQIMDFQISDDETMIFIASISDKMPLSVWNLESGRLLWQAPPGHVPVWRLQLLPQNRIATLGADNVLRIYIGKKHSE
jgi:WD40 repeat protein